MSDSKGLRIIVAEDDDVNMFIIMRILKENGHIGIEFPDGHLAWEYLQKHPKEVDMVILDKMMHKMHGMEVVKLMKEHDVLRDVPVIIQTGDVLPEILLKEASYAGIDVLATKVEEIFEAGVDGYVTKPFEDVDLLEVINGVAEKYNIG